MPQCFFYIDKEKQHYISATWKYDWSNLRLRLQEEEIGSFATKQELAAGRVFVIPDGHLLSVRLKGLVQPELEVLRSGVPLACSGAPAHYAQRTVAQLALFLGILNVTGGLVAEITQSDIMLSIGFGYGSVAIGAVYALLAWGTRRLTSFSALALALLVAADMVLLFVFTAMKEGPSSPLSGLLIKLFLVYAFLKGLRAVKQITAHAAATNA